MCRRQQNRSVLRRDYPMRHTSYQSNRLFNNALWFRPGGPVRTSLTRTDPPRKRNNTAPITSHSRLVASGKEPTYVVVQARKR